MAKLFHHKVNWLGWGGGGPFYFRQTVVKLTFFSTSLFVVSNAGIDAWNVLVDLTTEFECKTKSSIKCFWKKWDRLI